MGVLMVLALHGTLWVAHLNRGEREVRARFVASRLYWPVCGVVLASGIAVLSAQPWLAEDFIRRPERWIIPDIGAAGLLGMRFCLGTRWGLGSVLCSLVFMGGLFSSAAFVYRQFGAPHGRLNSSVHGEAYSGGRRSDVGEGITPGGSFQCRV
jgi:cytochrome bd-type quinol oxidase subunit 2